MRAWRSFLRAHAELIARLDQELVEAHGMSLGEYEVLVFLSEAPERRRRMSDLAQCVLISRSALTRRLDSLVRRGWVARVPCETDARVTYAVLSDEGLRQLETAAPAHVAGVRRHFIDRLTRDELQTLAAGLSKVPGVAPAARAGRSG